MIRSELTTRNSEKLVKANIESILPCTELQQAFYLLSQQSGSDPGVILAQAELAGQLDEAIFEKCWNLELARHESLRMSVRPKKDQTPMLVIWRELFQEVELLDASLDDASRQDLMTGMVTEVSLDKPPVSKVVLEPLGENRHRVYWALHHLFLDGWSTSVVLRDVVDRYCAHVDRGTEFYSASKPSYLEYFRNYQQRDYWAAREFWTGELDGYSGSPSLPSTRTKNDLDLVSSHSCKLSKKDSAGLQSLIRDRGLTSAVVATGAWSMLVHGLLDCHDVVVGLTVSGRNIPLEGIQNFAGLLSGVVPFRSQLQSSQSIDEWLLSIRESQFRSQQFEYLQLSDVHDVCEIRPTNSLFETLLVVENFVQPVGESDDSLLNVVNFASDATSTYPITCYVIPGKEWEIRTDVRANVLDAPEIARKLSNCFSRLLIDIAACDRTLAVEQLLGTVQPELASVLAENETALETVQNLDVEFSQTEIRLSSIWEAILGVPQVFPNDHFFEIGGKSLTAIRTCAAIEKEFGVKIAPTAIIEYPTLRQLAEKIAGGEDHDSELFRFNDVESENVLLCVHAGDGYASYYRHLAKYFDDCRVIGVQSKGLNDGRPAESLEELAEYLAEKIGPEIQGKNFQIVGYCMGAIFMFELARCLERKGYRASSMCIIDSGPYRRLDPYHLNEFIEAADSVFTGAFRYGYRLSRRRMRRALDYWYLNLAKFRNKQSDIEKLCHLIVRRRTTDSCHRYHFQETSIPVRLIRSHEYSSMESKDYHLDWQNFSTDFQTCVVDGVHQELMLEPFVSNVADAIRQIDMVNKPSANATIWQNCALDPRKL